MTSSSAITISRRHRLSPDAKLHLQVPRQPHRRRTPCLLSHRVLAVEKLETRTNVTGLPLGHYMNKIRDDQVIGPLPLQLPLLPLQLSPSRYGIQLHLTDTLAMSRGAIASVLSLPLARMGTRGHGVCYTPFWSIGISLEDETGSESVCSSLFSRFPRLHVCKCRTRCSLRLNPRSRFDRSHCGFGHMCSPCLRCVFRCRVNDLFTVKLVLHSLHVKG